ncbi:NAD+ synthase [Fontibacillus phaseoli]|uniref:NH(3)-dependent NAD(+) synthetase n=1 Tax=Fontibacillus phaseoli TaxID=1416533 RepID=A0A369B6P2_9BACL|nr:NAD(+) synthase [Fontibacillus phaseoli]RCX16197.1 NAD+ synthase [Fontibacillus phaseoli]
MSLQQEIIDRLRVKPVIDVEEEVRIRVDFLKEFVKSSRTTGLLVAISGGIDSAVATGLCKKASDELSRESGRDYITLGVFQPYGDREDIVHSYEVAKAFELSHTVETNIEEAVDEIALEVEYGLKNIGQFRHMSPQGKDHVKARTGTAVQYALAFELNLLVVGTYHASEVFTGFYSGHGDGGGDITPLSSLNKRQICQLAAYLGVPESMIDKEPTAGLGEGQRNEKEPGISNEDICDYLEGKEVDSAIRERLESFYRKTESKRNPIPGI